MRREIRMERRYSLGDYKYLSVYDGFFDVDEELALNEKFVNSLSYLQILSMEVAYRKYLKLMVENPYTVKDVEKGIIALEEIQTQELNKLRDITKELAVKINGKVKIEDNPQE